MTVQAASSRAEALNACAEQRKLSRLEGAEAAAYMRSCLKKPADAPPVTYSKKITTHEAVEVMPPDPVTEKTRGKKSSSPQ